MKHAGGRPSKYTPDFIAKVDEYLEKCEDKVLAFHKTRGDKTNSYERYIKTNLPKIEGFAEYIGVTKSTIYEWAEEHPEFSYAIDRIRDRQHNQLVDGGLSGRYNPTIASLMLSGNHGYRSKSDLTTDDKPLTLTFDNAFAPETKGDSQ